MPSSYKYKAMNAQGRLVTGLLDGANLTDLELRLSRMGLELVNYNERKGRRFYYQLKRVSRQELINFSFHLEQLTTAGVPLLEALRDLRDSTTEIGFREVVSDIIDAIDAGQSFSQALDGHRESFGSLYISLIGVGEESGRLGEVLKHLAEMLRWQDALGAKARKVMIYPAFVVCFILAVVTFLMVFVVPQLVNFMTNIGQDLPTHTRALIGTSAIFVNYWHWMALLGVSLFLFTKYADALSPRLGYHRDKWTLRVWVIGPMVYQIKLARFAKYFALMYASGITVLEAVNLSRKIVDNALLDAALVRVHEQISDGEGISHSFTSTGLFPPLVIRMLRVGETTGALDTALLNVSEYYSRKVAESIDKMEPIVGPTLILLLGLMMGWIMISVLGPIYDGLLTLGSF
jgi:type IV pilus assembly protein PilC